MREKQRERMSESGAGERQAGEQWQVRANAIKNHKTAADGHGSIGRGKE